MPTKIFKHHLVRHRKNPTPLLIKSVIQIHGDSFSLGVKKAVLKFSCNETLLKQKIFYTEKTFFEMNMSKLLKLL